MSDLATTLTTGLALGATYGLIAVAVALVWVGTRTLHLAIGPVLVVGVLLRLVLGAELVSAVPGAVAVLVGVAAAAALSAALEPLVLRPLRAWVPWLLGLAVAAAVVDAGAGRWLGTRTFRPAPLVGGTGERTLAGLEVSEPVLAALLLGLTAAVLLSLALARTTWGATLRLVGGSPDAAALLGVRPRVVRAGVLALAGAAAALAGLLVAPIGFVGVTQGATFTIRGVAAAVILGLGGPWRAIAGGLLLGVAEAVGQQVAPGISGDLAVALVALGVLVLAGGQQRREWGRAW